MYEIISFIIIIVLKQIIPQIDIFIEAKSKVKL